MKRKYQRVSDCPFEDGVCSTCFGYEGVGCKNRPHEKSDREDFFQTPMGITQITTNNEKIYIHASAPKISNILHQNVEIVIPPICKKRFQGIKANEGGITGPIFNLILMCVLPLSGNIIITLKELLEHPNITDSEFDFGMCKKTAGERLVFGSSNFGKELSKKIAYWLSHKVILLPKVSSFTNETRYNPLEIERKRIRLLNRKHVLTNQM